MKEAKFFILLMLFFASCHILPKDKSNKDILIKSIHFPTDTSKSFKVNQSWVTPKKSLEFDSLINTSKDTLEIVICGKFVYEPFGFIKDGSYLHKSLLKNFVRKSRVDIMDAGPETFEILTLKSSKLILFFDNDPDATIHSYILRGEIYDNDVEFKNHVKIGMSLANFYNCFFDYFPPNLIHNYKVFVLVSCIDNIKHIYTFDDGKLKSVAFLTDSYWKVDY